MSLTAPAVVQAVRGFREDDLTRFPHNGADIVVGQIVADLGLTRSMIATTVPREWERVASVLIAMLDRSPFRDSPRFSGERIILGALANELRAYAMAAGEPVGVTDLRAPEVIAGEREARDRAAMRHAV
jgi:hypothetical protein